MKKIMLIMLLIAGQAKSYNSNVYKWISLIASPIIYGKLALNSTTSKEQKNAREVAIKTNTQPQAINVQIRDQNPKLNAKNPNPKCLMCESSKKSTACTLLTYGSIINLLDKLISKDPGSIIDISLKPLVNAMLMYGTAYMLNKIPKQNI